MLATIEDGRVHLYSRNGRSYDTSYPAIATALAPIPHDVILDGELVIIDETGRTHFAALQHYGRNSADPLDGELRYYVFDMLYLNGLSMLELPLVQRKSLLPELLAELGGNSPMVRYCEHIIGQGIDMARALTALELL